MRYTFLIFLLFSNCIALAVEHWERVELDSTWDDFHNARSDFYDMDCYDADNCIAVARVDFDQTYARLTTDGGVSWTTCLRDTFLRDSAGYKIYLSPHPYSVRYYSPDLCTIMADSGYYWVSHDKCQTWDKHEIDTYHPLAKKKLWMVNADFCDSLFGIAGSRTNVYLTQDGANSFHEIENFPFPDSVFVTKQVKIYDRNNIVVLGYSKDRGDYIIRSEDGAETWFESEEISPRASAIHLLGPKHILAVAGDQTKPNSSNYRTAVQESFDGGQTWHINMDTLVWPRKRFIDVEFADSLNGLARGTFNNFWWTRDGGKTWVQDTSDYYTGMLWFPGMAYPRKDVAYFCGQMHAAVHKWTDDGINVTEPFPEPAGRLMLFPNPVEQGAPLYLRIQADMLPAPTVRMFDMEGRQGAPDFRPQAQGVYRLKTSGLAPGTYTVQMHCRTGTFTAKVIVR